MQLRARSLAVALVALVVAQLALAAAVLVAYHLARRRLPDAVATAEQWILGPRLDPAYLGDGGPASDLLLCYPMGLAMNRAGELLISDRGRDRRGRVVWRIDAAGIAHIVAGTGRRGDAAGRRALELDLDRPESMAVAPDDSFFLSDGFLHRVFRIDAKGNVERYAGTGARGYDGDGGPATEAAFNYPEALFVDARGRMFIGDEWNQAVRMVDERGIVSTVMGTGFPGRAWIGGVAHGSPLDDPEAVLGTPDGLIVTDGNNGRVIRISDGGIIEVVAGRSETAPCSSW